VAGWAAGLAPWASWGFSFVRSFWVLADAEGNEACVCTWTGRDEQQ